MNIRLHKIEKPESRIIKISGSKSETNRALLLKALQHSIQIENGSDSDDSYLMLQAISEKKEVIDIGHAGTAMRFLTAYFAIQPDCSVIIKGSDRMHERPIGILVEALKQLGAEIHYLEKQGYPPLKIIGKKLIQNRISIQATVSSQYISALLLIAFRLENGLRLQLIGKVTSVPYIKMTLQMLNRIGVKTDWTDDVITVYPASELADTTLSIESDWSSASYYYAIIALSPVGTFLELRDFEKESLQGDACIIRIYENFGVTTHFNGKSIRLEKVASPAKEYLEADLTNAPDIAQTIAVTCLGLNILCNLTGLHTLRIKETDRLQALKNEIEKWGGTVCITENSLQLTSKININRDTKPVSIKTYQDHRMAMAFAPLALKTTLDIQEVEVVSKSYPDFWKDLKKIGFKMQEL